jgi:hypothetical protein
MKKCAIKGVMMLDKLKRIAEYFTVNWLDGQWVVYIEKMNKGIRVDVSGEMSIDLDVAISTAIDAAQQKMHLTRPRLWARARRQGCNDNAAQHSVEPTIILCDEGCGKVAEFHRCWDHIT